MRERVQQIRNESKSKAAITSSSSASAHPGLEQGHVELFLPARSARLVYRFLIVFLFFFRPQFSLDFHCSSSRLIVPDINVTAY